MKRIFGRFERGVGARNGGGVRNIVAAAVGRPNGELVAGFPGDLVAAGGLLHRDRGPGADLADGDRAAPEFQRGAGAAGVAEVVQISDYGQAGRAG